MSKGSKWLVLGGKCAGALFTYYLPPTTYHPLSET